METVKINCKCGLEIEYWTKNNYIECPDCKEIIKVEPCVEVEEIDEEIEANGDIEIYPEEPAK